MTAATGTHDSLARHIEYLILEGATHKDAPNLGSDVLDLMDEFVARYLALPDEHARHTLVLWCAHTWLMDCWEHTPRLLLTSPEAGCGKTRSLVIAGQLVPRPDHVADLTPAAFYHSIDEALELKGGRPTVLFDEFDTVFGTADGGGRTRNEDMRRLINGGHDRNETVSRKIGKRTKRFQIFAAMALAGKMTVADVPATIRTRAIVIPMQRRLPGEKIERWTRREGAAEAEPIRWMLQCWAELVHSRAADYVGPDRPALPTDVEDRDADVWEPVLAVAELAGGHWPERARVAAVTAVTAAGMKAASSPGLELLAGIRAVFDELKVDAIHTVDLLSELATMDPRWRRLDGKKLAAMLHNYGMFETNKGQRIGENVAKGYRREYFSDTWARYLSSAVTAVTHEEDDDE